MSEQHAAHQRAPKFAWITRLVSIAFIALNAYGWIKESSARQDGALSLSGDVLNNWAVTTHLLPLILIVLGLIFGWQQPQYGLLAFVLFAGLQAVAAGSEWVYYPFVVLPPLVIAALFAVGWWLAKRASEKGSNPSN